MPRSTAVKAISSINWRACDEHFPRFLAKAARNCNYTDAAGSEKRDPIAAEYVSPVYVIEHLLLFLVHHKLAPSAFEAAYGLELDPREGRAARIDVARAREHVKVDR